MTSALSRGFWWLVVREKAVQPPHLRFPKDVHPRAAEQPNLPGGVNHNLANNAYCMRDNRRATRPLTRFGNTQYTPLLPAKPTQPPQAIPASAAGAAPASPPPAPAATAPK